MQKLIEKTPKNSNSINLSGSAISSKGNAGFENPAFKAWQDKKIQTKLSESRSTDISEREADMVMLSPADTGIPEGKTVNAVGLVAPEANLRTIPDTGTTPIKLLTMNTRVQVIKEVKGNWYYISTEEGDTGYVASHFIKINLPEPSAILHQVGDGETAIGIAEKYYRSYSTQWGQDLRFFVNVLLYANKGAGDSSKGIYTEHAGDRWKECQVKSGFYIWIPSAAYAKSLQGTVSSGSITYGVKEGIENTIKFFQQKIDDFNYANQFVAKLLPGKLSGEILDTIKSALITFALGLVLAVLILAIAAGIGALIGALVGFLAGGVGAAPGAALGAKIGLEIGLFLLKWIGLGMLIVQGASLLGSIGIAFGKYVINVWEANGDHAKLESSADLCAEAVKEFLLGVLELVIVLVLALGLGKALGALKNTKFGKAIGYDKLAEWISLRSKLTTTKLVTIDVFKITLAEFKVLASSGKVEAVEIFMKKMGTSFKENPLRIEYETKVNKLAELANMFKKQGKSQKAIAETLSQMRRDLGVEYKDASPPILRDYIYEINMTRYKDPLGPDFKWLMKKYDGDYSKIIEASSRPNPNIDILLGGFREWLVGKL